MNILKHARRVLAGVIATGATITIAACYGTTDMSPDYSPQGKVLDSITGDPIAGIEVCVVQQTYSACEITDSNGYFWIPVDPNLHWDAYELCATDVDGETNGTYDPSCISIQADTQDVDEVIELDPTVQ